MNYIGSKLSLLKFLEESIQQVVGTNSCVFADIFSGTSVVGLHFKQLGYQIIANDLQYYSYVLAQHYIGTNQELDFAGLSNVITKLPRIPVAMRKEVVCDFLQRLQGESGFIHQNFAPNSSNTISRQYFTSENAMKCDAIRSKIEAWFKSDKISHNEYYFLLTTLLQAVDKVANTASVYGAYLKNYKKSALRPLMLLSANVYISNIAHTVYNNDANSLVRKINPNILYLDPPYNERQYSANYHVLETIAKYDTPDLHGITGLRDWTNQKSQYCQKRSVGELLADLIDNTSAKYIFLSYNNEGLIDSTKIRDIMSSYGEYGVFTKEHSRFKADSKHKNSSSTTIEYLHYIIK